MRGGACSSCKALIVWAVTVKGKAIPIDAQPVAGGNVALVPDSDPRGPPIAHVAPNLPENAPALRYQSHFASCPNAAEHRK